MSSSRRHFSPAEAAERLGVTVRALRVYERRGLVKPLRTSAGWRVYGPEQLESLHKVLALKGLGLSLAQIGGLLGGRLAELDAVLALQEQALKTRRADAERGLALLDKARQRLACGGTLSLDDLTTLARETTMSNHLSNQDWQDIFDPLIEKHYSAEEREQALARKFEAGSAMNIDQDEMNRIWDGLFGEARRLMTEGDPGSPRAMDLARRWQAEVDRFSGGDADLNAKSAAVWQEALTDPKTAPKLPVSAEVFAFVGEAARRARAQAAS